jgi:cold shock CspA family protein
MTEDILLKTGIVKFYSIASGYGFILDDETGSDIFVQSNLNELNKDNKVIFKLEKKGNKFCASDIRLL